MGFRLRKSIQVLPGVRVNVSKRGLGVSAGVPGYRVGVSPGGRVTRTISAPGTGISHVTTSSLGGGRGRGSGSAAGGASRATAAAPAPVARPPKAPGWFAPRGHKALWAALAERDAAAVDAVGRDHPDQRFAAAVLAGFLHLEAGALDRAWELLWWAWSTGADPATDDFIRDHVRLRFDLAVAPGVAASLGVDRDALGLAVAELAQLRADPATAIGVVESLTPTSVTAVSLAELYVVVGRGDDVIALTDGLEAVDDLTALLLVLRGVALRDGGHHTAAREAFRAALRSKRWDPEIRRLAWWERAQCYLAEGKRASARTDLERILAEDAGYPGLRDALAALG